MFLKVCELDQKLLSGIYQLAPYFFGIKLIASISKFFFSLVLTTVLLVNRIGGKDRIPDAGVGWSILRTLRTLHVSSLDKCCTRNGNADMI
jgi:hypothetical protein